MDLKEFVASGEHEGAGINVDARPGFFIAVHLCSLVPPPVSPRFGKVCSVPEYAAWLPFLFGRAIFASPLSSSP